MRVIAIFWHKRLFCGNIHIMDKNTPISISTGTLFRIALVGLLFWMLFFFRDLVLVLLTAIVIASAIEPLTKWLTKYKIPRILAVIFIYLSFAVFIVGIFYFFLPPLLSDMAGLLGALPQHVETLEFKNPFGGSLFGEETIGSNTAKEAFSLKETLLELRGSIFNASGGVLKSLSAVFGGLFGLLLIVVISFYLAVQERGIENFLRLITPLKHEKYIVSLWERSQKKIGLWMQGQLLLGLIVGVLVYLGLTVLGVKYAFLLAVLSAMFELIPAFGPVLAAIPAVMIGLLDGLTLGLMVLGLYVIIQQFENHLIYPLVVRKVVGVSPIMVIIALIIGAKLAGFLGILLSVPIAAALMEFADDVQKEKLAQAAKGSH
jgi:predicted PurR-regulated permease PerM